MKDVLLALLADGPAHGYELKHAVETTLGEAWPPLNIGQVYTTLGRLERDGLVASAHVAQEGRPDKRVYALTHAGRESVRAWIETPVAAPRLKDEFFTKLVLAQRPGVARLNGACSPAAMLAAQRRAYLATLRDLQRVLRREEDAGRAAGAAALLIEGAMLHIEADLKWLDLCEQRLG